MGGIDLLDAKCENCGYPFEECRCSCPYCGETSLCDCCIGI